jgi:hypothetical protein
MDPHTRQRQQEVINGLPASTFVAMKGLPPADFFAALTDHQKEPFLDSVAELVRSAVKARKDNDKQNDLVKALSQVSLLNTSLFCYFYCSPIPSRLLCLSG